MRKTIKMCYSRTAPYLRENILFGDGLYYSSRLGHISVAEDKNFVSIKDSITVFIKNNQLVAVFLMHFFPELSDAGLFTPAGKFVLGVHPAPEGRGQCHGDNGQVDMRTKGLGAVSGRALDEPGLL